jgi:hypothetical protein
VDRGLKRGDVISTILFNIVLEYVISRLTITPKGTIFNRMTQCIAYVDDIVILISQRGKLFERDGYVRS